MPISLEHAGLVPVGGAPEGFDALIIADLARRARKGAARPGGELLHVARDDARMARLIDALRFADPEIEIVDFPAWDCLPYDRVSPHAAIIAQRMTALSRLARIQGRDKPAVLLTTVNAALQRVPAKGLIARQALSAAPGNTLLMAKEPGGNVVIEY